MGCCGDREKQEFLRTEQKWDYINLDDFKSSSCWTFIAYGYLWIMLLVSLSVYAVDTFTCINLIAFDRWSGQIKPAIPFAIARWIFAGCILLSFLLLVYRWWRAIRVMKQGGVAKSYLDPLAVRIQSIRMGQEGRGWKRFLVFAELTKSRKGADYVALFSYFSFEAWLRIIFAEGPRQVVNGITLYSVAQADLVPVGLNAATDGTSPFVQFWRNVGVLADKDRLQVAILFGMVWTVLIWIIAAISLGVSVVLYLIFLWHHIPAQDGTLTVYCRKKINRRMERVVKVKVDKALKKENELRVREEARAAREGIASIKKQPTLPNITTSSGDSMPSLSRQTTVTTLPEYQSRPGSVRNSNETVPPLPTTFNDHKPGLQRHTTQASDASWASYNSNAPLMSGAANMGYSPADGAQTPGSAISTPWSARPIHNRSVTGHSQFSDQSFTPGPRPGTSQSIRNGPESYQMEQIPRPGTSNSSMSRGSRRQYSDPENPGISRGQTPASANPYSANAIGSYFPPIPESDMSARSSSAFDPPPRSFTPGGPPNNRSYTPTGPPPQFPQQPPYPDRSYTPAGPPPTQSSQQTSYQDRSYTPAGPPPHQPSQQPPYPDRSYSPAPSHYFNNGQLPYNRSHTPIEQPQRSFTPQGPPEYRAYNSQTHPPLPRLQTSNSVASTGYTAFSPISAATPVSTVNSNQEYRSFSRPIGPGQHNSNSSSNRDSDFDDILRHY